MGANAASIPFIYMSGHCGANTIYYPCNPVTGEWTHFAVATDAAGTRLYVNGELVAQNTTFVNNTATAGTQLGIGVASAPSGADPNTDPNIGYFAGDLDDVRIYNRALTPRELQSLAAGAGPPGWTDCQQSCGNGLLDPGEQCDDGNAIAGDGCSPTCLVGPGCFQFPLAGLDTFETAAVVTVQISETLTELVALSGPTVVERGDPTDPGDGRREVPTEIVSMDLSGTSAILGNLNVLESAARHSAGQIKAQGPSADFPADSFFDVFFEIETTLPAPFDRLYNLNPLRMRQVLDCIPPLGVIYQPPPGVQRIPLFDTAGNQVATLVHAQHEVITPFCGDGVQDPWEDCDDGNTVDCDGCDRNCKLPACGNGIRCAPEECDGSDDAACPGKCDASCTCAVCGDNVAQGPAETCDGTDDENCPGHCPPPGDPNECRCAPVCGDNVVQSPEECDGTAVAACPAGPGTVECLPPGDPNECRCRPGLDHFMSYKVKATKGTPDFMPFGPVTLADQFDTAPYNVQKPTQLALPADKNGEGRTDAVTHLEEYPIKRANTAPKFVPPPDVRVVNQCSELVLAVQKPASLLVPTNKDLAAPVQPPDASQPTVDHFVCYKAKVEKNLPDGTPVAGFPKGIQVDVVDQFQTRHYDLTKVTKLCAPVDKSGTPVLLSGPHKAQPVPITPAAIRNQAAHLVCYQAKLAKAVIPQTGCGPAQPGDKGSKIDPPQEKHVKRIAVNVNNQFGPGKLDTTGEAEFCIPSTKAILPP